MKKYTVIALSVSGLKNKIFRHGDEVTENSFLPGRAEELARKEFLKEIGSDNIVPNDNVGQPEIIPNDINVDDITMSEIKSDLKKWEVLFPNNMSKSDLFELWKKSRK